MKKIIYLAVTTLLICCIISCNKEEDPSKRNSHFEVPELTLSNTIQFTVDAGIKGYASLILDGGKVAVDWGDGEITKDINPGSGEVLRSEFTHSYKTAGHYRIKIWTDELTFLSVSSLLNSYEQLHVGTCPVLTYAMLNSFFRDKTLNLNGCKKLESLNLGNWEQLESVTLDECVNLNDVLIYTNPHLSMLDFSKNTKLVTLECIDSGIEELKLPKSIVDVKCTRNKLTNITLKDYYNLIRFRCDGNENLTTLSLTGSENLNVITFSDTQIESFDFSEFPELYEINCGNTKMTAPDISANEALTALYCTGLGMSSLDITKNIYLKYLDCSDNTLTSLDVSKNSHFRQLYLQKNQFDKNNLETIFNALPDFDLVTAKSVAPTPQPSVIKIDNNPGAAECNTKLITDKGWVIK